MTKLNKQGVRDLNARPKVNAGLGNLPPLMTQEAAQVREHFGKHQLPGELAAQLLAGKPVEFGPPLTAETQEFLQILAEECAETIQRATKILRFGVRVSPWDGKSTVEKLESEIGDILAALDVLADIGLIDLKRIEGHKLRKLRAFVIEEDPQRPRLRHITPGLRAKIAARFRR